MKIGIAVGDIWRPATFEELIGQARAAVELGFGTVWAAQALGWDALTALTAVGCHVPDVQLGTAVVPVAQRHPLVLAGQALSVQAATGDRLTLGVGAGIGMMVRTMYGLPADRPVRRMREYLEVLRPLLRGESVAHQGETLTAAGAVEVPGARPPQVLLAALGPAMLALAGELADGVVTWMTGPRTLAGHIVPAVTKAADSAGRPAPRVVAGLLVCVTDDVAGARERAAERFGLAGRVPEYRAVLDREGVDGPQDVVVAGDEEAVAAQLGRLAEAGVGECMAVPFGTEEEWRRTTEVLGRWSGPA
ncbi:TIGR03564 family F420-dependent LLM class oxidoreductase [Nonomuraea rhizosphaerae]|uniref:TIGR03564 family F420-dependent LLM class oxidoreductase n=1 Tax=Nonomuraea rhizosphaerae TaxID=2665663 RepID=UPI0027E311A1|nr:TIGR03564 family F420-dependent LLM class oxidoreductase [Nonomuraea rhizosphaerae]